MFRRYAGAVAVVASAALIGCGARPPEIVPAAGVVLLDGAPLPKVRVVFYPQVGNSSDYIAQGVTDDQGRFTLRCKGQPGACAAENVVAVVDEIPEEMTATSARAEFDVYMKSLKNRPVPAHFRSASESPVKVTVSAGQAEYKIELRR